MATIPTKDADLPSFFEGSKQQTSITPYNISIIGHVDHGKSTLVGALLYKTGAIASHLLEEYKRKAAALQKESFFLAWVMDQTKEERERGVTISSAHAELITPKKRYFTIIDNPGHVSFLSNAITGISQADIALLVADVQNDGYAVAKRSKELSTVEHLRLCKFGGVEAIIVALNKMDAIPKQKRAEIFEQRTKEIKQLLKMNGFKVDNPDLVKVIPVAAREFYNIAQRDPGFMQYEGETLLQAMDSVKLPEGKAELPLRFYIEGLNHGIAGTSVVATGKVVTGTLRPGDQISIKPGGVGVAKTIQMHKKPVIEAVAGSNIGISLKIGSDVKLTKGAVISHIKDAPKVAKYVIAKCTIIQHPSAVAVDSRLILHHQTLTTSARIVKIQNVETLTGKMVQAGSAEMIAPLHKAIITLEPEKPLAIDTYETNPYTASFSLRDCNMTVGFGTCESVVVADTELA